MRSPLQPSKRRAIHEENEVTLNDLRRWIWQRKPCYTKVQFSGEKAQEGGLHPFLVENCCIDRTNEFL